MRTRTNFIIGFSIVISLFVLSSGINWNYSQELKQVSEYHNSMSIPAVMYLDHVNLRYHQMHSEAKQSILGISDVNKFENAKISLLDNIQEYNDLRYMKNSDGQFFAPPMMDNQMSAYVTQFHENVNFYNSIFLKFQNDEITKNDVLPLLDLKKSEFDIILQQDMQMELNGVTTNQNYIHAIELDMYYSFLILNGIAILVAILITIYITRFTSKPLSLLLQMTKNIANGNFETKKITTSNSDMKDLIQATNEMAIKLENYKSALIKNEKLSSIGTLSSRLSHDIRNPLTVIKTRFDLIKIQKKDQLTQKDLKDFEDISNAIERISHQINNVLDFVGGKKLTTSRHSLHDILDSTMNDISKSDEIKISTIGHDVDIECDFKGLKIILINLIINAIQAIGKEGTIKINICEQTDHVSIEVEDSGPGIPNDELESIFEPLFTTKQEGTGLGLASCQSIAEQHGGTISVQNNPTRFTINLPKSPNQKETILKFEK